MQWSIMYDPIELFGYSSVVNPQLSHEKRREEEFRCY